MKYRLVVDDNDKICDGAIWEDLDGMITYKCVAMSKQCTKRDLCIRNNVVFLKGSEHLVPIYGVEEEL